jgi:photosystem II stability/assembly factor-like uncharacterized protein
VSIACLIVALTAAAAAGVEVPAQAGPERWTSHGPDGGLVSSIAFDPVDPKVMYAAGRGVFRSTDGGLSWIRRSDGLGDLIVHTLTMDGSGPDTVYAAGDYQHAGVLKTTDGGRSWLPVNNGLGNLDVPVVAADPTNPGTVWAGTRGGLFKTTDGGSSWRREIQDAEGMEILSVAIDPRASDTVYAGAQGSGVYKTTDDGKTWHAKNKGLDCYSMLIEELTIDPSDPDTIYAGTAGCGVFKSTDAADSWTRSDIGLPSGAVGSLAVDPMDSSVLYAGLRDYPPKGFYKSTDGAQTWVLQTGVVGHLPVYDLTITTTAPSTLYAASFGVYASTNDAGTWQERFAGIRADPWAVAVSSSNPRIVYAGSQNGVARSADGGLTWITRSHGLDDRWVTSLAVDSSDPDTVFAGEEAGGVYKTTDGGRHWADTGLPVSGSAGFPAMDPPAPGGVSGVMKGTGGADAIAIDPSETHTVYVAVGSSVVKSTDGGLRWEDIGGGMLNGASAVAIDPSDPGTVYVGTQYPEQGVFKTTDGGRTWKPSGMAGKGILSLAVDPIDSTTVWAGTGVGGNGMYKSTDGGTTWRAAGLSGRFVYDVAADPVRPDWAYAGVGSGGVWRTIDGGKTWDAFGDELAGRYAQGLAITSDGSTIHAAVRPGGVYEYSR